VIPEGDAPWFCDMCKFSKRAGGSSRRVEQECILCPEKGGAMKRTTDGRWAHITCALWVPNAQFLDAEGRDVIHPFAIHEDRLKLVCTICDKRMGACIQCKAPPRCLTPPLRGVITARHISIRFDPFSALGASLPHRLPRHLRPKAGLAHGRKGEERLGAAGGAFRSPPAPPHSPPHPQRPAPLPTPP